MTVQAEYRNGGIYLGRLPIAPSQARDLRDLMAGKLPSDCIYETAQEYVRDLDQALEQYERERAMEPA